MLKRLATLICLSIMSAPHVIAGDLAPPPGPIAPTNRLILSQTTTPPPHIISAPGSYVLTSDLIAGSFSPVIEIAVGNVTIDLNGFTIDGADTSFWGIRVLASASGVTIKNGTIRRCKTAGISGDGPAARIEDVTFLANNHATILARGALVINCLARENTVAGFVASEDAQFVNCVATFNDGIGIHSAKGLILGCHSADNAGHGIQMYEGMVKDCHSSRNAGNGINSIYRLTAIECTVTLNNQSGISAVGDAYIDRCAISGNARHGIRVDGQGTITNNQCFGDGNISGTQFACIYVFNGHVRVEGNNCAAGQIGIKLVGSSNIVVRNTCSGNGINYDIGGLNAVGQIVDVSGGLFITTSESWLNFEY